MRHARTLTACCNSKIFIDPTHHVASVAYVDLAWAKGDARLADEHASRAFAGANWLGHKIPGRT